MLTSNLVITLVVYVEDGWLPIIPVENITRSLIKSYIDRQIFEDELNPSLQQETNTCVALVTSDTEKATFEVLDGYASPCLKNKDTRFVIE